MKTQTPSFLAVGAAALLCAVSLVGTSHAQFVNLPPGTPQGGVALPDNTPGALSGTVIASMSNPFVDNAQPLPFASGILKSFVIDRGAGSGYDFVYQLVNTSVPPPDDLSEFFRLKTVNGFEGFTTSVANTNAFSGLSVAPGVTFVPASFTMGAQLEDAATADRDVGSVGSVGFDFPTQPPSPFIGNPDNVGQGESSSFLVVRTNARSFSQVQAQVSGAATGLANVFAPVVPEPGTVGFGLAMLGVCASRALKRRKMSVEA